MIFNSAAPTGNDTDLGTPNKNFLNGTGDGSGGENSNYLPYGNVLIISSDGDAKDPDDYASGGTMKFEFMHPSCLHNIGLLDREENEVILIKLFDKDNIEIKTIDVSDINKPWGAVGSNSYIKVPINVDNVKKMEVIFAGSGALTHVTYTICIPSEQDQFVMINKSDKQSTGWFWNNK